MAAELCPVCEGTGKIFDKINSTAYEPYYRCCHGCNGKGWVETGSVPMIPYTPSLEPFPFPYPYPYPIIARYYSDVSL